MGPFRSQVQFLLEGAIASLGWTLAPPERELDASIANTTPLQVAYRWVSVVTTPDQNKPGAAGVPMTKAMTWTLAYAAQVHSGAKGSTSLRYLAADLPDMLAQVLLDRQGPFWAGVRNISTAGRNFLYGVEIGADVQSPPSGINANGKSQGQITFTVRVEIDARTDLELVTAGES